MYLLACVDNTYFNINIFCDVTCNIQEQPQPYAAPVLFCVSQATYALKCDVLFTVSL